MSIDSVVFDIDGVLWDALGAYIRCTVHVTERFCREQDLPAPGVTFDDVLAFKRVGGFNSDWDMTWTLIVLSQAKVVGSISEGRAWKQLAVESAGEGMAWTRRYAGADAPDFEHLQRYFDAHYWGADRYPAIYDRPPLLDFRPGFADAEAPLASPDLMPALRRSGVERVGIITGRNRHELRTPLAGLNFAGMLDRAAVFTDESGHKPNAELLRQAATRLNTRRGVMVGDSIDDLRTVLHYRQLPAAQRPAEFYAVQIAPAEEAPGWYADGADLVLSSVNDLPHSLQQFA